MKTFFFADEKELVSFPSSLSADINHLLDQAFPQESPRDYVGASSLGDACARRIQYQRLGVPPDMPLSGTQHRIFEQGHVLEGVMANWLQKAGFSLETLDPTTQKPFEFQQAKGQIRGHVDGILRSGPLNLPYPLLWEAKTMKAALWRDFVKKGLAISHPHYFVQVQLYMAYLNLEACLLTALNKDTAELHHEQIPFQAYVAAEVSDKAVHILKALENNEILPRLAAKPNYFICKMCRFYKTCWKEAL